MNNIRIVSGSVICKNPESGMVRVNFRDGVQTHGENSGSVSCKIASGTFGEPFKHPPAKYLSIPKFSIKSKNQTEKTKSMFEVDAIVKAGFSEITWSSKQGEILEISFLFFGEE